MVISQFDHRSLVISICGGGSDCICDWPAIVFLVPPSIIFPGGVGGGGRPRGRCEVIDVLHRSSSFFAYSSFFLLLLIDMWFMAGLAGRGEGPHKGMRGGGEGRVGEGEVCQGLQQAPANPGR